MTVSELILELIRMRPDMPIKIMEYENGIPIEFNGSIEVVHVLNECYIHLKELPPVPESNRLNGGGGIPCLI